MAVQNHNPQSPTSSSPAQTPAQPTAPKPPRRATASFTDANANSLSDKLLRWELLEQRLEPVLETMPYVKPLHAELVRLVGQAKAFEFKVKAVKAANRKMVADRKGLVTSGDAIRSRLAAALAFEHGPTSVLLTEFGLRPRRGGGRRKKAASSATPAPDAGSAETVTAVK